MAEFNFDNLAANLPDGLRKDKDSNNYKLLLIEKIIYDRILKILQDVEACLDIDNCSDATLDLWGKRLQVARGTSNNEQYRLRIKSKIAQSLCDGSRDSIAYALAYILSCDTNKIKIKSGTQKNTVDIINIPLEVLYNAKIPTEQITEILNSLLPTGVTLGNINFGGTFVLSEIGAEKSTETGLSDIDGTTGGTLGQIGGN